MTRGIYKGKPSIAVSIRNSLLVLLLGVSLGAASKWADLHSPFLAELTSGIAVWILLASAVALCSRSPARAGLHVLLLLGGMLAAYYAAAELLDSTWPEQFLIGWGILAVLSPIPGMLVWHARKQDMPAWVVSFGVVVVQLGATWLLFRKIGVVDLLVVLATAVLLFWGKFGKRKKRRII